MFGSRLKQIREEKGISQIDMAKLFSIANTTISQWESGKRNPDHDTLIKIADYFKVSVDWLLGLTDYRCSADMVKENATPYYTDPMLDDLLKKVPDLTNEEKESLAEHMQFALKQIEKERQRRSKEL